jgi:hypothetical protein
MNLIAIIANWLVLQVRRPGDTMTDAQFCQMQRELDWIDRGANCSPTACRHITLRVPDRASIYQIGNMGRN